MVWPTGWPASRPVGGPVGWPVDRPGDCLVGRGLPVGGPLKDKQGGRGEVGSQGPQINHPSINKSSQRYHAYIPVGGLGEGSSV